VKPWLVERGVGIEILCAVVLCVSSLSAYSQSVYERSFPQSKATIEKALQEMRGKMAGRLPVLDGFANPSEHAGQSLDHYERGYYQAQAQVVSTASGGATVRISTKVTAWYSDPGAASQSGYRVLTSNGRVETDLLDELAERLTKNASTGKSTEAISQKSEAVPIPAVTHAPVIAAPTSDTDKGAFSSSLSQSLWAQERGLSPSSLPSSSEKDEVKQDRELQAEADSLQEVLKNQAHPKNLVAVKKSGTPVVASASLSAKTLFMASLHDEFEMLDFNSDWVHVRISGLSRGWIWRDSLEMPEGIPDTAAHPAKPKPAAADLFQVSREEIAPFPGDWEPLRNKSVKIMTVQKLEENGKDSGAQARLEFAKYLLDTGFAELTQKHQDLAGIVLIFDSSDGGMIAATLPTLQQWKTGTLSDAALWHKCFFDPPEGFSSTPSAASQ
jgi:hypothetical protein